MDRRKTTEILKRINSCIIFLLHNQFQCAQVLKCLADESYLGCGDTDAGMTEHHIVNKVPFLIPKYELFLERHMLSYHSQTFKQAQRMGGKSIIKEGSIGQEPSNKTSSSNSDNYGTITAVGDDSFSLGHLFVRHFGRELVIRCIYLWAQDAFFRKNAL
jgi:hypothetical protein